MHTHVFCFAGVSLSRFSDDILCWMMLLRAPVWVWQRRGNSSTDQYQTPPRLSDVLLAVFLSQSASLSPCPSRCARCTPGGATVCRAVSFNTKPFKHRALVWIGFKKVLFFPFCCKWWLSRVRYIKRAEWAIFISSAFVLKIEEYFVPYRSMLQEEYNPTSYNARRISPDMHAAQ